MILAAALIVLQLAGLVLTIIAPLALLVGIHPGVGRTVTMQWLELWLGVWLKRIILTAVLSQHITTRDGDRREQASHTVEVVPRQSEWRVDGMVL